MRTITQVAATIPLIIFAISAIAEDPTQETINSILLHQRNSGGWPKNIDYSKTIDKAALLRAKSEIDTTIDNGATTEEMQILAQAYTRTRNETYRAAFINGLKFCLKAQYGNGGWPQKFPDTSGYHAHITFNDDAMINVMELLKQIAEEVSYDFVDQDLREQSSQAVQNGIDCLLKCQIIADGKRTVWCAQHNQDTFLPTKARSYELPSFSGSESVGIVRFLMGIKNPSKNIIDSIEGAIEWFNVHQVRGFKVIRNSTPNSPNGFDRIVIADVDAPGMWARFYDLETIEPFFCSRDGIPKRQLSEISYERRNGYSWYTTSARGLLTKDYPRWRKRNQN
jgi:PelA/Pel-15E family pectate lyase